MKILCIIPSSLLFKIFQNDNMEIFQKQNSAHLLIEIALSPFFLDSQTTMEASLPPPDLQP